MMPDKMSDASPRLKAAPELREALDEWQAASRATASVTWCPRDLTSRSLRTHLAFVTIRRTEEHDDGEQQVERTRSVTVEVVATPGADPEDALADLDRVASALRRGTRAARRVAAASGL